MDEDAISSLIVESCAIQNDDQIIQRLLTAAWKTDVSEAYNISLVGSRVEFSIKPVSSEFGDYDIIVNEKDEIAEFGNVEFEETSDQRRRGLNRGVRVRLKKNFDIEYARQGTEGTYSLETIRNLLCPGFQAIGGQTNNYRFLKGVRCMDWLPDAEHWSRRQRMFDWPTSETIQLVNNIGCDLINTPNEDRMRDISQWRLSFARAEVILVRSWTRNQQIVYHMLRYFVKNQWSGGNEILTVYHIKTLMLWASEENHSDFWKSECVIYICAVLLENLSVWLTRGICRHYFIPEWNLFEFQTKDDKLNQCIETVKLHSNPQKLKDWFARNYLRTFEPPRTRGPTDHLYFRRESFNL